MEKIKNDPMTGLMMATLGGAPYNAGLNSSPPPKKKDKEDILYAVDCELEILCILIKGQRGEQHKIF